MGEAAGSEEDQAQETAFKEVQNVLLGLRGESMVDDNWLRHIIRQNLFFLAKLGEFLAYSLRVRGHSS